MAEQLTMQRERSGIGALTAGGAAAILASTCCLGPLVLVTLGIGGAWIGNLAALEPYRPFFAGAAVVALLFAYRAIFRTASACEPGQVCAVSPVKAGYKVVFWIVAALALIALAFPYIAPLFF